MKKTNNFFRMLAAGITVMSVVFLVSCNKDLRDKQTAAGSVDNGTAAGGLIGQFSFDNSWNESQQGLKGKPKNGAKFSSTAQAQAGSAAFLSKDSGYVSYADAGTIANLTSGFTVDFWVYATNPSGGAHCIWAEPQTGEFWPAHHVLLDGYNDAKGDTGLLKIMFKGNKGTTYNEQWTEVPNIPKFYNHWVHVQYAYDGASSTFTVKLNGKKVIDHQMKYTDDPATVGLPFGNINPNPAPHGILIGAFQNQSDPALFGDPEPWMGKFAGRIDEFKIYKTALF